MRQAYLKIENPGVAPSEAFTLLGASTKRNSTNASTIGSFGTGNKMSVGVLLRNDIQPVIFAGFLKMDFGTRKETINDGLRKTEFNRVFVKFGGKDNDGIHRSSTEDLGFVLEHGATEWHEPALALREFISNALDRAVEEGEHKFVNAFINKQNDPLEFKYKARNNGPEFKILTDTLTEYRKTATDYKNVVVEVVQENQVRAKAGYTRIFVPVTDEVASFYANIGKWFLHFSEPHLLNTAILPKQNRNLGDSKTAVIYRRGVRVREVLTDSTPSLYDYNLENLQLDESRKVDDYYVKAMAAQALANATEKEIAPIFQTLFADQLCWEHSFSSDYLANCKTSYWKSAFIKTMGEDAILATKGTADIAARKGFHVVVAPEQLVYAAARHGVPTPATMLSLDELQGREIIETTPFAQSVVDFVWEVIENKNMTNGKEKPLVKSFRKIMDGGSLLLGYYNDNTVFINQDITGGISRQLMTTALEECVHHATQAKDSSRDFQDYILNLLVDVIAQCHAIQL